MADSAKDPTTGIALRFVKQYDIARDTASLNFACWVSKTWYEAYRKSLKETSESLKEPQTNE